MTSPPGNIIGKPYLGPDFDHSLGLFADMKIEDANPPVDGVVTLKMQLSEPFLHGLTWLKSSESGALKQLQADADMKIIDQLVDELGHYGLSPRNGTFDPETREFTFTVEKREVPPGDEIPRPEETRERAEHYVAGFARAREAMERRSDHEERQRRGCRG